MSAVENSQAWPSISEEKLISKYEKCRNITEEIYKRINLTFEIKKLETNPQSDISEHSDHIDSNELSNETDLFACDKSDTISSSTEAEKPSATCDKYININNNEETKQQKTTGTVHRRPRKRFRKRVKKRQSKAKSESEGSSDEALPLSRMVDVDTKCKNQSEDDNSKSESLDNVMGVPNIVIITKDLKQKLETAAKESTESSKQENVCKIKEGQETEVRKTDVHNKRKIILENVPKVDEKSPQLNCTLCNLSFKGERGLRRHMTMSHITSSDESKITVRQEFRGTRPA